MQKSVQVEAGSRAVQTTSFAYSVLFFFSLLKETKNGKGWETQGKRESIQRFGKGMLSVLETKIY